jgi:lactate permease
MSTRMGEALSGLGVWTVPALGMVGSVLAGSITGSLSMFATTFGSIAHITGSPELPIVAAGMAASGLANGASPARAALAVTMAVQALPPDSALRPAEPAERSAAERSVLGWVVALSAVSAAGVALALTLTV